MERRTLFERMSSIARAEVAQVPNFRRGDVTPDPRGQSRSDQVRRSVTSGTDKKL